MASDITIGGVGIIISGDYSKLQADFVAAQALATRAGAGIASGLTAGMAPAAAGASAAVTTLNRTLTGLNTTTGQTVVYGRAAGVALEGLAGAATVAAGAETELAATTAATIPVIEAQNAALGHGVSQIQATSGALRVLEGSGGIRAAERFLTMIPGLGAALQMAFPIIGAIALFDMIARMIPKVGELTEAEKALAEATKANDAEWERLANQLEHTNVERMTEQFGKAKGLKLQGFYDQAAADHDQRELQITADKIKTAERLLQDAKDARAELIETPLNPVTIGKNLDVTSTFGEGSIKDRVANLRKLQDEYATAEERLRVFNDTQKKLGEDTTRAQLEEGGALSGAVIADRIAAGEHLAAQQKAWSDEQIRQDHAAQQLRILGIADTGTRSIAEAQEELRVAQANQAAITAQLATEVPKRIALIRAAGAAEAMGKTPDEQKRIGVTTETKVGDFQAQSDAKSLEASKVTAAARDRLAETTVTVNMEAANKTAQAWFTAWSDILTTGKETYTQISLAAEAAIQTNAKVMEIQAKGKGQTDALAIEKEKLLAERAFGLQIVVTGAQRIAYAQQLAAFDDRERTQKLTGLAAEYQIALAIADEGKKKEEIARIEQEMAAESGKAANASIADQTKILELKKAQSYAGQVGAKIGGGSVLDNSTAAAANLTVQAVDGIAGALAKAAVQGKHLGDIFVQLGKQLALSALTSVLKIGLDAVLKSLLNLIPVFGTVAAAQASAAAASKATQSAAAVANVVSAAGEGAAWGFESVMAALPFPYNVAVAPGVAAATFGEIMGFAGAAAFAEGGRPPVGIASIVGERGPELFIPDQAGQIVPAGKFGGGGVALPNISGVSSSSSQSIGELHVHAHGVTNPKEFVRQVARELPNYLKTTNPVFSPASK